MSTAVMTEAERPTTVYRRARGTHLQKKHIGVEPIVENLKKLTPEGGKEDLQRGVLEAFESGRDR